MSLINEALKRAKETQNKDQSKAPAITQSPVQTVVEPRMRPVEAKPPSTAPVIYILSAALVVVLLGAMVLLWIWSKSSQQTMAKQNEAVPVVNAEMKPITTAVAPSEAASANPNAIPVKVVPSANAPVVAQTIAVETKAEVPQIPTAENTIAVAEPELVAVPETVPATPQFPALRLQGIFYNRANPSAVINGKTYAKGGVVFGARITEIEPDKVTVQWNGETRVLETAQ